MCRRGVRLWAFRHNFLPPTVVSAGKEGIPSVAQVVLGDPLETNMKRKTLKLIALGYVVKTLLFGIAWIFVPDLPQRTASVVRDTWTYVAGAD